MSAQAIEHARSAAAIGYRQFTTFSGLAVDDRLCRKLSQGDGACRDYGLYRSPRCDHRARRAQSSEARRLDRSWH